MVEMATDSSEQALPNDEFVPEKVDLRRRGMRRGQNGGEEKTVENNMLSSNANNVVQNSDIHSSVVFAEDNNDGNMLDEDVALFSEVDKLCPHDHEGGDIAKEPALTRSLGSSSASSSQMKGSYLSFASSFRESAKRSISSSRVLTNELDQINTSRSSDYTPINTDGGETTNGMVSSVDWSSLTKSCKRAKETMRDAVSSHVVVKNMFLTHLSALTTVLTLYARRYTDKRVKDTRVAMEEVLTRTIETRRALRFAIVCLAPTLSESDFDYGSAKQTRQQLQVAAVEGERLPSAGKNDENGARHHALQVSLAELIVSAPLPFERMVVIPDGEKYEKMISSLEKNQLSVRTLAARLLCNLVTDNPAAAAKVLFDIPFAPTQEQLEKRMSGQVLATNCDDKLGDSTPTWSDLIHAVSQTQTIKEQAIGVVVEDGRCTDREVLAAVVAALHNLLVSMETHDSFLQIAAEVKRLEKLKQNRLRSMSTISEEEVDKDCDRQSDSEKPIDALFEAASSPVLVNALLRSTLPATTIIKMLQPPPTSTKDSSRPKFVPPNVDQAPVEDTSDSATEWISFVLERLVSRGLMLQVLRSAGGKGASTTPEQVVLVSCIRQAVDDYQLSLPSATESGAFDMRRLSITAKSRNERKTPHPLWGRGDGLRTAVPVLHSLANEAEKMRKRALQLQSSCDGELSTEEYEGELSCTNHIIHDIRDILAQCLGQSSTQAYNDQCIVAEARSVLGRETTLIANCCEDLAQIVDVSLTKNSGKSARELQLSSHEQETAISTVRLIGNIVYQCQHNQNLLRSTVAFQMAELNAGRSMKDKSVLNRTGLHVLLSATSLGPACFTLREWCIVAIRNAVENNEANIEMVRRLEANEALGDTPELQKMGVKVDLDDKGNVRVQKRDANN